MASDVEHPWFPDVMDLLDLRKRDRALLITAQRPRYVEAVAQRVGSSGDILVLEPDRNAASEVAEAMPRVEIIVLTPTGKETFGSFDALLACPLGAPVWPLDLWSGVTARSLRPGGRFAIDLPGEELCEDLSSCWLDIGGSEEKLIPIRGPSEQDLATNLRQGGLRMVAAAMGTHIVGLDSPHALASLGAELLGANVEQAEELGIALTRRLRTTGPVEVVFHRTRVHGIR